MDDHTGLRFGKRSHSPLLNRTTEICFGFINFSNFQLIPVDTGQTASKII